MEWSHEDATQLQHKTLTFKFAALACYFPTWCWHQSVSNGASCRLKSIRKSIPRRIYMDKISQEVLDRILGFLSDDNKALVNLSLTSKSL